MKQGRNEEDRPACGHALLIDPSVRGQSHILVNTGFIEIALRMYKDVTVIAHQSHVDALLQYMSLELSASVRFISYTDSNEMMKAYKQENANSLIENIIFLNIEHSFYHKVNTMNILAGRKNLFWVAHSHFLSFNNPGKLNRIKNIVKKISLFNAIYKSKIIVCGKNIEGNINAIINQGKKIRPVFHPIGIDPLPVYKQVEVMDEVKVSLIHINGWHEASAIKVDTIEKINNVANLSSGLIFNDVKSGVSTDQGERRFNRDYHDRLQMISEFSYFIHIPEDAYRLQASGALMDLLLTRTPVIGLKTDFGSELGKAIGSFGYFFDSHESLVDFIRSADPATMLADRLGFVRNLANGYNIVKAMSLREAEIALR